MRSMPPELERRHGPRAELSPRGSTLLLGGAIGLSVLVYGFASGGSHGIWILPDELTSGLLARSLATTGHFALRGVNTLAYPIGYPALIATAFVGRGPVAAYDAGKWLNAFLMSLSALPVFLIGRRLLSRRLALAAAVLTLLIPSMAYTRVLMTENAFFPLFLLAMLAFIRALERPTFARQLVALATIVPATAVRSEGLVLLPAFVIAMVLQALGAAERVRGRYGRALATELWRFRTALVVLPALFLAAVLAELAVGKKPTALLGRYANALKGYPLARTLKWAVYETVDLELYLAIVPFVPALVMAAALLAGRRTPRQERAVAAAAVPTTALLLLAAAAESQGNQGGGRYDYILSPPEVHDRYCFFVAPLFFVLFLAWLARRGNFSNRVLVPLALAASALPLTLPYAHVHSNADFDALALLPWSNGHIAGRNVHYAMAVTALILCALLVPRRKSVVLLQVCLMVLGLVIMDVVAENEVARASTHLPSSRVHDRGWIDRSVPPGSRVAAVWVGEPEWPARKIVDREEALWRAEFFNRSVSRFFYVDRAMYFDLPETAASLAHGRLVAPGESTRGYRFLLVASPVRVDGIVIARDRRAGLTLYRVARASP